MEFMKFMEFITSNHVDLTSYATANAIILNWQLFFSLLFFISIQRHLQWLTFNCFNILPAFTRVRHEFQTEFDGTLPVTNF